MSKDLELEIITLGSKVMYWSSSAIYSFQRHQIKTGIVIFIPLWFHKIVWIQLCTLTKFGCVRSSLWPEIHKVVKKTWGSFTSSISKNKNENIFDPFPSSFLLIPTTNRFDIITYWTKFHWFRIIIFLQNLEFSAIVRSWIRNR